jgi:hypothetical protein
MMPASLRALLERSIDYAGMFPPCSLGLEPALKNQAQYVRSPDTWMLSTFVLPVAQFEAAEKDLSQFDPKHALRISALGPKTETAAEFIAALKTVTEAIRSFQTQHADLVSVVQLEMPLPTNNAGPARTDLGVLNEARSAIGDLKLQAFWEGPIDAAEQTIALLAAHNSKTKAAAFGYKLRTGGVTVDAFPVSIQIARALIAAVKHHVPIKFTAGLHHPVRQFRDEVQTKMHGFLNVLGAGVLAAEHQWNEQQTVAMLEDEDAAAFSFHDTVFAWREWEITMDRIKARRKLVTSFGSCSFDEPREDLRALGFL